MASVEVRKDIHSVYIQCAMRINDTIKFDWVLPESYTAVLIKGSVVFGVEPAATPALGLYRVAVGEKLEVEATEASVLFVPFLLSDTSAMDAMFTVADDPRTASDYYNVTDFQSTAYRVNSTISESTGPSENLVLTLADLQGIALTAKGA